MKLKIIIVIILFVHSYIISQNEINAYVFDRDDNVALEYAHISIKDTEVGVLTDSTGYFSLIIDSSYISRKLIISYVGYQNLTLNYSEMLKMDTLYLRRRKTELDEIAIIAKGSGKPYEIKEYRKKNKNDSGVCNCIEKNFQVASRVAKEKVYGGKIKSISVFITKKTKKEKSFRLRIYEYDKFTKQYIDILVKSLVFKNRGKGWFKMNLEKYNVYVPDDGFLVSYEWLNIPENKDEKCIGQCIGFYLSDEKSNIFAKREGGHWTNYQIFKRDDKFYNLMLRIEID